MKKYLIDDYLVIHRYGKVKPGENIVLIVVAAKHRKESFRFGEGLMDWLKVKATFWKKENFASVSSSDALVGSSTFITVGGARVAIVKSLS